MMKYIRCSSTRKCRGVKVYRSFSHIKLAIAFLLCRIFKSDFLAPLLQPLPLKLGALGYNWIIRTEILYSPVFAFLLEVMLSTCRCLVTCLLPWGFALADRWTLLADPKVRSFHVLSRVRDVHALVRSRSSPLAPSRADTEETGLAMWFVGMPRRTVEGSSSPPPRAPVHCFRCSNFGLYFPLLISHTVNLISNRRSANFSLPCIVLEVSSPFLRGPWPNPCYD